MTDNFTFELDEDGVALLTLDLKDRSMNVITMEMMSELESLIDRIAGDDTIKGAVITSGKPTFLAGADLTMLAALSKRAGRQGSDPALGPERFQGSGRTGVHEPQGGPGLHG